MPYALFCHEARLSKAYPTEADVWKRAQQSGLLVDVAWDNEATPRLIFENDYEIRPCPPDHPQEDLDENQADGEWRAEMDFLPFWAGWEAIR